MPDLIQLALFFAAALVLAVTPGPGIFYVAARSLAGGRAEGVSSSFGTGLGRHGSRRRRELGGLGPCAGERRAVHGAQADRRGLPGLARLPHVPIGPQGSGWAYRRTGGAGDRDLAGVPRRGACRGAESEDGGVLPGVHSSVRGPGRRPRRDAVRGARYHLGRAQYGCRHRGRRGGERHPGGRRCPSGAGPATPRRVGSRHDSPRLGLTLAKRPGG
jgi:hypothetical protein